MNPHEPEDLDAGGEVAPDGEGAVGRRLRPGQSPAATTCPGDLNRDGHTDQADLGILIADWGCTSDCAGDCDNDGDTDQADLGILLAHWGEGC